MWAELSAADAERLGLGEGDLAEVRSPRGSIRARVRISGVRTGVVFVPFHYGWWDREEDEESRAANELTITSWDPVSKQPLFKAGAVAVVKVADSDGVVSVAPTNTASAPVADIGTATRGQEGHAAETEIQAP